LDKLPLRLTCLEIPYPWTGKVVKFLKKDSVVEAGHLGEMGRLGIDRAIIGLLARFTEQQIIE